MQSQFADSLPGALIPILESSGGSEVKLENGGSAGATTASRVCIQSVTAAKRPYNNLLDEHHIQLVVPF